MHPAPLWEPQVRANPEFPRRDQFRIVRDKKRNRLKRSKTQGGTGSKAITSGQFEEMGRSMGDMVMSGDLARFGPTGELRMEEEDGGRMGEEGEEGNAWKGGRGRRSWGL